MARLQGDNDECRCCSVVASSDGLRYSSKYPLWNGLTIRWGIDHLTVQNEEILVDFLEASCLLRALTSTGLLRHNHNRQIQ